MNPLFVIIAALQFSLAGVHAAPPLNILFFTADDMNYDSTGVCGRPIKNLTPHIDRLAAEGLRFEHAYSTVAVCQPVRQTMQTGLYPHRSGSMGFFPIKPEVHTLNQQLHDAGYLISMFGKGKSNSYENNSRGALVIRWPGVTTPGLVDRDHLVSTLDFTPTLLDAARLPAIPSVDGRSFVPAVKGNKMDGWDRVFTFYNAAFGSNWLPMRCVRTKDRSYIWNAWSDGKRKYQTENMAGLSWKSMLAAAESSPEIKARTEFYLHRVPEEFYDMSNDRNERVNPIAAPAGKSTGSGDSRRWPANRGSRSAEAAPAHLARRCGHR